MIASKDIKDLLIREKAGELTSGIESFTDELPDNAACDFKTRLRYSAGRFPESPDKSSKSGFKTERLENMIKARAVLEECRDYISLINKLKFHNADKLKDLIDEIYIILKKNHSEVIG